MDDQLINQLVFFQTPESPCSYLPNLQSRSIFLNPEQPLTPEVYHLLNFSGFRRSGTHMYRPWCDHCQACQATRVLAPDFRLSRNQRKVFKLNQDLTFQWCKAELTDEYYDLYADYINQRHEDGDMYPPSREQFDNFLCQADDAVNNYFLCLRLNGKLIAVSVIDLLPDGPSAIYTFFAPQEQHRSLGKLVILWLINWAKQAKLPYVYLGYWVKNCHKMSYKADYRPLEVFNGQQWVALPESTP